MRIFKTRWFNKWAAREGLRDAVLQAAVKEMEDGLIDAELGGHVMKKREAMPGRGKRGGMRTLVVYQQADKAFFVYGFAKSERANIGNRQLRALKLLADRLLGYNKATMAKAMNAGELLELQADE